MDDQTVDQAILADARKIETAPEAGEHPPKPQLTLRVGVIGPAIGAGAMSASCQAIVRKQLDAIFASIDKTLAGIRRDEPCYDDARPHQVRLVCGTVEEADSLAIAARPKGWAFDAILPFPEASCRNHLAHLGLPHPASVIKRFETGRAQATTLLELPEDRQVSHLKGDPETETRRAQRRHDRAYARSRAFLLGQIDVLIIVWDGRDDGRPADVALAARQAIRISVPVVWISTEEISEQNFPRLIEDIEPDGTPVFTFVSCLDGGLSDAISEIVAVPSDRAPETGGKRQTASLARERLERFFKETWPLLTHSVVYDAFKRLVQVKLPRTRIRIDYHNDYREPWTTCIGASPGAGSLDGRIGTLLMTRYAWADGLAVAFSHRYRSAFVLCHALAALAMFVALLGILHVPEWMHFFHLPAWMHFADLTFKGILVSLECLLVACVGLIVWRGRRGHWQEKWIEYRALAEMLRDVRFLAYLGEHGQIQRRDRLDPASAAWFVWYLRATIREIGLPHAVLDGEYQHTLLRAVENHVVKEQLKYHRDNRVTMSRMHKLVHGGANVSFISTWVLLFILLIFFVAVVGLPVPVGLGATTPAAPDAASTVMGHMLLDGKDKITFLVAFLTALGAAFAGVREAAEFENAAEHSAKTTAALQDLERDIAQAKRELTLDTTSDVLLKTAQVLTEDLGAWQSVYGRKQLNLT